MRVITAIRGLEPSSIPHYTFRSLHITGLAEGKEFNFTSKTKYLTHIYCPTQQHFRLLIKIHEVFKGARKNKF